LYEWLRLRIYGKVSNIPSEELGSAGAIKPFKKGAKWAVLVLFSSALKPLIFKVLRGFLGVQSWQLRRPAGLPLPRCSARLLALQSNLVHEHDPRCFRCSRKFSLIDINEFLRRCDDRSIHHLNCAARRYTNLGGHFIHVDLRTELENKGKEQDQGGTIVEVSQDGKYWKVEESRSKEQGWDVKLEWSREKHEVFE